MGSTVIDKYLLTAQGREQIRKSLEEHHDDQCVCERIDIDDVGKERKSYYLELSEQEFELAKAWRWSRQERLSPHR